MYLVFLKNILKPAWVYLVHFPDCRIGVKLLFDNFC